MNPTRAILVLAAFAFPMAAIAQKRPAFGDNDSVRVEVRAKIQADFRAFSPHLTTDEGAFDFSRARLGIEGRFLKHFGYQLEYEFREHLGGRELERPLRDAYIDFDYLDDFQFKIGKFKLPFSLEQITSAVNLDFVLRSRISDTLAPGRDVGAMLHGRFFNRGIGYEAGVFQHDGENVAPGNFDGPRGGRTAAARVIGMPLRWSVIPGTFRETEIGAAVTSNNLPEGSTNLRGRAYSNELFFPRDYHTRGHRLRLGAEFNWTDDPFSVKAEFIRVREEREGQSVRATDLPDIIDQGWYLSGTWYVIGEDVQLAARYERIGFSSSGDPPGMPSRSPRAPNIMENSDRAWTLGVNWFPNPYLKIQINGIAEKFKDPQQSPLEGRDRLWMGIVRVQFAM